MDKILNAIKTILLQKPDAAKAFGSFLDEDQIAANLVKMVQWQWPSTQCSCRHILGKCHAHTYALGGWIIECCW